jgi:hypothetical protein
MKEGEVILTPLPQADGNIKPRPALVLREMPPYRMKFFLSFFLILARIDNILAV